MEIDMLCFRFNREIVCLNTFAYNYINLSKKQVKYLMTSEEYRQILEQLYENGEELPIIEFENHRYAPRIYYRIYTISLSLDKHKVFMEVFDGTSASYEYVFCKSKRQCKQIIEEREKGNKKLY